MQHLTSHFEELFGKSDNLKTFFCPGRVNLIGEHIDYLGGHVLPAAISLGITAISRKNGLKEIRVYSADFDQLMSIDLADIPQRKVGDWADFVRGVARALQDKGMDVPGIDVHLSSTLPKSSGLSSSAALEVLIYYLLYCEATELEPDRTRMALDCQRIENEFIGVNCGIMDQFAVANGKKNHAILLNCSSVESKLVPLDLGDHVLLIINSNKPRTLAESAYNQRRLECEQALNSISNTRPIKNLVDATDADLELIEDPISRKRCKHAFSEECRVLASELLLQNADLKRFGKLMTESHDSLKDDFEVSCPELDFIVAQLNASNHCLGARMTGAGFGGCCVALVQSDFIGPISDALSTTYTQQFGYKPSFYSCIPSDGVHRVKG